MGLAMKNLPKELLHTHWTHTLCVQHTVGTAHVPGNLVSLSNANCSSDYVPKLRTTVALFFNDHF